MQVLLNNNLEIIDSEFGIISIVDILKFKNYTFKILEVRVNNKVVAKNNYNTPLVKKNDMVDIIHLTNGR